MKEIFLETNDKIKIAVNHHKTGHEKVIIIAHGWFMTKDSKAFSDLACSFEKDFDVLSMDFRGHGKSSGFYTFTAKENIELKTVVDFAKNNYKKVYLIGFSLGGALAIIHGAFEKNIDKIIAVSAPYSFEKIENHMWKKEAWKPTLQKFEFKRWISIRPSIVIRKKIKPIDVIEKLETPTLFITGKNDPTVHEWHTKSLFKEAKCDKKYECFDSTHAEDLFIDEPEKFMKTCIDWLRQ